MHIHDKGRVGYSRVRFSRRITIMGSMMTYEFYKHRKYDVENEREQDQYGMTPISNN